MLKLLTNRGGVISIINSKVKNSIFVIKGKNTQINFGYHINLSNVSISIVDNASLFIGNETSLINCNILLRYRDTSLFIEGGNTEACNTKFWIDHPGSYIKIKPNFSMQGGNISAIEGKSISIGEDCMFSEGIEIRTSDSHGIYSLETKERINHPENVIISNHVWLCANSIVLKGSFIPDNVVIGNSSIVSRKLEESNAIYAGSPAKLVKKDITWDRELKAFLK